MGNTKRIYFQTEKTVVTKTKGWIDIETDYTQIYHNIFLHTKNLKSKYCLHYLLWIMTRLGKENMIPHNEYVLQEFCNEFEDKPSIGTVRNAITELIKAKLILKFSNTSYAMNPVVFWGEDINKRIEHIKHLENTKDIDYKIIETIEEKKLIST